MSTEVIKEFKLDSIYIVETSLSELKTRRGTCFSISDNLLLTANHVVEGGKSIKVYLSSDDFANEKSIDADCIYQNSNIDVAILKVNDGNVSSLIELYRTNVNLDSKVKSCGYPIEKEHYHAPINVEVTNTFAHMTSKEWSFEVSQSNTVSQYKGMSGSPVLFEGKCIGILLVQQGENTLYSVSTDDFLKDQAIYEIVEAASIQIIAQEGIDYKAPSHPTSPFKYCIHCTDGVPSIKGVDIGFTFEQWNMNHFTETVYDWIIDYSLSHKDRANFNGNPRRLFKYARSNYPASDLNALGDLCLHIAIRESYSTIPIMNRVFDQNNKTFSCTHAILNFDNIELWIGASSVSTNIDLAVNSVIDNINYIATLQSLQTRLYALTSEIDSSWPHKEKLERLANSSLPIDQRFDKIIIPIFIMHDSELITDYDKQSFLSSFEEKINECRGLINEGGINKGFISLIDLKVFYFPVSSIFQLNEALVEELNS
ncbi:Hachiman antiphage defense system protein HamA, partial [Vibrio splendidus]